MKRSTAISAIVASAAASLCHPGGDPGAAQSVHASLAQDPAGARGRRGRQPGRWSARRACTRAPSDTLVRTGVQAGGNGLQYVSYERTYRGLPVVGGDAVVVTNAAGAVLRHRGRPVGRSSPSARPPRSSRRGARPPRKAQLVTVDEASTPRLVVLAWGTPTLAWETIAGRRRGRRCGRASCTSSSTPPPARSPTRTTRSARAPATASTSARHHRHLRLRLVVLDGRLDPPGHPLRRPERRHLHRHRRRVGQRLRHQPRDRLRRRAVRRAERVGHAVGLARPQRHQRQRQRLPGPGRPQPTSTPSGTAASPASATTRPTPRQATQHRRGGARVRPRHLPDHARRRGQRQRERRHQRGHRRHLRRADRGVRQQPQRPAGLHRRRRGQPGRHRPDPLHVQPVRWPATRTAGRRRSPTPRCTPRPVRSTTGSTWCRRATTRPAGRPARSATAASHR